MNAGEDLCLGSIYMIWKMRRKLFVQLKRILECVDACTAEDELR
jgi:hypothetical protein